MLQAGPELVHRGEEPLAESCDGIGITALSPHSKS